MRPAPAAALAAGVAARAASAVRASATPPPPRLVRTVRALPSASRALALTADGATAFVVAPLFGQVCRVRLCDGALEVPPRLWDEPAAGGDDEASGLGVRLRSLGAKAAATPDGETVFVAGAESLEAPLYVFDGSTDCAQVGVLRVDDARGACAVQLSADGAHLLVGGRGSVVVMDAKAAAAAARNGGEAPAPRAVLRADGQLLHAAALATSAGGALAALCGSGRWALWRDPLRPGPPDAADRLPCGAARALALAADGRTLVAGGSDDYRFGTHEGCLCRWARSAGGDAHASSAATDADAGAGAALEAWASPPSEAAPYAPSVLLHGEVQALAMTADGSRVFVANSRGLMAEWRPHSPDAQPTPLEEPAEDAARESWREPPQVHALALDAAGRTLVGLREASDGAELLVWAL